MERFITDERTGLKYELVGDCCLIAGDRYAGYAGFFVRTMRQNIIFCLTCFLICVKMKAARCFVCRYIMKEDTT